MSELAAQSCPYCGAGEGDRHGAREMMLGTRDRFTYAECAGCASLWLLDSPDELGHYYPEGYYSLAPRRRRPLPVRLAKRARAEAAVRGWDGAEAVLGRLGPPLHWKRWLQIAGKDRSASICDVGCGSGELLASLREQGFRRLAGADPFIERDLVRDGIPIRKATPAELEGSWDLVMLNHAFEHIPDPVGTLAELRGLLEPDGVLMLRVPVAGCEAWRRYNTDWVALDPPRHLHVPSPAGLRAAAGAARLEPFETLYDSTAMQFWRSELYRADIPLFDPDTGERADPEARFGRVRLAEWEREAAELNRRGRGDNAAFFLRAT